MPLLAWLLNLVYLAVAVPVIAYRVILKRKSLNAWREKFLGRVARRESTSPCLWIHAVSVGEVVQLEPLIEALSQRRSDVEIVVSTTTATGFDVARKRYPELQTFYFPLDFSWAVNAALSRIRPSAIVLVELELWPNFIFAAARRGIPVMLANGRITERSFRGYRRIRPLIAAVLNRISVLAVQSELYARRLTQLGADTARIHITGSIKFDRVEADRSNPRTMELRKAFGIGENERVLIAGSTQAPEERYAIESYLSLKPKFPDLRLILVPRHKERFDEVARLVEYEFKLPLIRRSTLLAPACDSSPGPQAASCASSRPILLLDTLGELSSCWGLANIAFVGGSLTGRGGQNMIEPAGFGAALLFGPDTWNFKDVVELLLENRAARVINGPAELTAQLDALLADPAQALELGNRARQLVAAQRGAAAQTIELLLPFLPMQREDKPAQSIAAGWPGRVQSTGRVA
jgi:3-deoxy-D-manno-octulosonic-acid transferase